LSSDELSKKIQWIIDLGGTDEVVETIIHDVCSKSNRDSGVKIHNIGKPLPSKPKKLLAFLWRSTDYGHWVYFNKHGEKQDSYQLQHQKERSHQFCQTFATIYAISDCNPEYKTRFFDKLKSGKEHFGDNICVVVDFWKHVLDLSSDGYGVKNQNPDFSQWLIREVRRINDELLENHLTRVTRTRAPETNAIAEKSSNIDLDFIMGKLDDIVKYADQIATQI